MGRVRYYTDEHVSRAVIGGLRQRGVDVLSVPEANQLGASDLEHLAFALAEGRVGLVHNFGHPTSRSPGACGKALILNGVSAKHQQE